MATNRDFVAGNLPGKFVNLTSNEAGDRRWADVRRRHRLSASKDVPEHPANRGQEHYDIARRAGLLAAGPSAAPTVPEETSRWYPVAKCILESYGDLRYRICMHFAMPSMAVEGTFEEAQRALHNKQKGALSRSRLVNFRAVDHGTHIERYSATGRKDRLAITHEILGFEVRDAGSSVSALWCPEGLAQARTVLGEINGSSVLLGTGLMGGGVLLINDTDYQALATREFDRGEQRRGAGVKAGS